MYDRNYEMSFGGSMTSGVKNLIIANGAVFMLQMIGVISTQFFGLVPALVVQKLYVWQLVTYMFLHGGMFHIFLNLFVLWMFGSEIERHWGTREFYKYYFITGFGAGIFNVVFQHSAQFSIVGASGAIYGLLLAYGLMFPNRPILLYFLFPIPAKYFVLLFGALAFFSAFSAGNDGIAHFAHLGGMVVGFLYLRFDWRISQALSQLKSTGRSKVMNLHRGKNDDSEDVKGRIDEILDKINEVGYENLTEEEKGILHRASKYFINRDK